MKRGTARTLSLRQPPPPIVLASVTGTDHGVLSVVAGMNGKTWVVDTAGRVIRDSGLYVGAGSIRDTRPVAGGMQAIKFEAATL